MSLSKCCDAQKCLSGEMVSRGLGLEGSPHWRPAPMFTGAWGRVNTPPQVGNLPHSPATPVTLFGEAG
jgi:hypothetical protein